MVQRHEALQTGVSRNEIKIDLGTSSASMTCTNIRVYTTKITWSNDLNGYYLIQKDNMHTRSLYNDYFNDYILGRCICIT